MEIFTVTTVDASRYPYRINVEAFSTEEKAIESIRKIIAEEELLDIDDDGSIKEYVDECIEDMLKNTYGDISFDTAEFYIHYDSQCMLH